MSNESKPVKGEHWVGNISGVSVEIADITSDFIRIRYPSGILALLSPSRLLYLYTKIDGTVTSTTTKKAVSKNKVALPLEVFNDQPVDPKKAWKELKRACSN